MKSIVVTNGGGLDNLNVQNFDVPQPSEGEVLIKWHATSLNYHDYLVVMGLIPVNEGRVPMSDGAGQIVGIGAGVESLNVGDKVMSLFFPDWKEGNPNPSSIQKISGESTDGFICEYSCLSQDQVTLMPKGFTYEAAATLPCAGLTAWNGLMNGKSTLKPNDSVLIEGTGGMSLLGLQIAKAFGAKIYATTSSKEKEEMLYDLGVEQVFNYKEDPKWGKTIYKTTGGIDHILDVGGGSTMSQSIEAVGMNGNITSIGILGDGRKGTITFPKIFFKFVTIRGIAVGSRKMQMDFVDAIENKNITPVIDAKSFGFLELKEAFLYQESNAQFGKIVVTW
jgi:NADPH:quinone reductase-like Zn-dependent oxidoreductase